MINIIADPFTYRSPEDGAMLVQGPADYVRARIALRRALDQGQRLTVHVSDQLVLHWLADLAGYVGVSWHEVGPEVDFRRLFDTEPDPLLTAEVLVGVRIAEITPPPPGSTVEPSAWILGERLDPLWRFSTGSPSHVRALLEWALQPDSVLPAYLLPVAQQRLAIWAEAEAAYRFLRAGSLKSDAAALVRRFALQRYDSAWLREQGLADLPLLLAPPSDEQCVQALLEVAPAIERYWRQRNAGQAVDRDRIHAMLGQMSGYSAIELRLIVGLLNGHDTLLDQQLLAALQRRFGALPGAERSLATLSMRVPPPLPAAPEAGWSDERWLSWATQEYEPYFLWTVRFDQDRTLQQRYAHSYEQWLVTRYPAWLMSGASPLITRQFTLLRDLLDTHPQAVVVWLVIDGLGWWQGELFETVCRHEGLFVQRSEVGVALLPSLTDISKRGLVKGMAEPIVARGSIAQAAREKFAEARITAAVSYQADALLDSLQAPELPRCLLWFTNQLDSLAHDRSDIPDDELVRGYLAKLARTLSTMRLLAQERGLSFHVLVGSDHGSTLLPSDAPTKRPPQATREVVDIWEEAESRQTGQTASTRAVVVTDPHLLPRDQLAGWHVLERQSFLLLQDYLVPQGYAAVGRKPSGWTHGGLTPEETLVPLIHLASEPLKLERLQISLTGSIRSRQASSLSLVIVNPNTAPLDAVTIRVADLPVVHVPRMITMGRFETSIAFPARLIETSEFTLHVALEGAILGTAYGQTETIALPVRRLQTEDTFDDLFG